MSKEFGRLIKISGKMWYPTKIYEQQLITSLVSY